jgi:hypothetical protein
MGRAAILFLLLLLLLWACGGDGADERAAPERMHARGPIVAHVQGTAIGLEQVRELAQATGLSPRDALSRLEDAVLLQQRAEQLGYQRSELVQRETRRALVQALLAETVEAEVKPEAVPDAELRARFESERIRLGIPAESYPEHVPALRQQLVAERRKAALETLLGELRAATRISLDEAHVRKLLADPALWGAAR